MLQTYGSGLKPDDFDNMEYYRYALYQACIAAETKVHNRKMEEAKTGGAQEEVYFGSESDYG